MNVLINAISIVEGGGLVVLRELLKEMREVDPKIIWYIAAPPSTLSHLSPSDRIVLLPNTWANKSPLHLFCWYEFSLPQLINQFNIELCFSKTNFLPRRKMKCPSLLLIHHAGFFSDEFEMLYLAWRRKRTASFIWKQKKKWMNSSIKKAEHVTVQTIVLADKIKNETKITEKKISVIPHGTGMIDFYSEKIKSHSSGSFRIGYITKFGVQKDFETAINAVRQLKAERYPVKLILTLETNSSDSLYHMMKDDDVTDVIENYGEVSDISNIKKIYESLHLFIFPSWCESFGFTLLEAMAFGLPVVASKSASNLEILGDEGEFFERGQAAQLVTSIKKMMLSQELFRRSSMVSINRAKQYSWNKTAKAMINLMHQIKENHGI